MMPDNIIKVSPKNIAEFYAVQYTHGDEDSLAAIEWLASRYGWRVLGEGVLTRRGRDSSVLTVEGRRKKRYKIEDNRWVIALGNNGSILVMDDDQFQVTYKEVQQ